MHGAGRRTPEPTPVPGGEPARVAARLARLARTGNSDVLWPDVPRSRRVAAARHVAAAVSGVLAARPTHLEAGDLPALGIAAFISGVGPLLGRWIADGSMTADPAAARLFADHLEANRARTTRLTHESRQVVAMLRDLGTEPIVLKGLHLASFYPEPAARLQSDIDLLVSPGLRETVERHLRTRGWEPTPGSPEAYRTSWRAPHAPAQPTRLDRAGPDDPWTLDLHWTLDRARGVARAPIGNAHTVTRGAFRIGEMPVAVLADHEMMLFIALQTSLSYDALQLLRLVDLVMIGRRQPDAWPAALAGARDRDVLDVLFPAAALVHRLAPDVVPPAVLDGARRAAHPRLRAVVDASEYATLLHRDTPTLRQKLMWARGPGELVRTLGRMVLEPGVHTWRRRARLLAQHLRRER